MCNIVQHIIHLLLVSLLPLTSLSSKSVLNGFNRLHWLWHRILSAVVDHRGFGDTQAPPQTEGTLGSVATWPCLDLRKLGIQLNQSESKQL